MEAITKDLERILRKRKKKGEDIGKLLVYSYMNDIFKSLTPPQIISEKIGSTVTEQYLKEQINKLDNKEEIAIYKFYSNMYNSLIDLYKHRSLMIEKVLYGTEKTYNILEQALIYETMKQTAIKRPLLITPKQYEKAGKENTIFKIARQYPEDTIEYKKAITSGVDVVQCNESEEYEQPDKVLLDIIEPMKFQNMDIKEVKRIRSKRIENPLKDIFAINSFLQVIEKAYKIQGLSIVGEIVNVNIEPLIENTNALLQKARENCKHNKEISKIIEEAFPLINTDDFKPTKTNIKLVTEFFQEDKYSLEKATMFRHLGFIITDLFKMEK